MNAVQKKLLDLLRVFIQVCGELELPYFLLCGSALGAVKYEGFIPWDDDVDVGMLREDYDVFCARAQELLPEHCFLQNYETDPCFPAIYSKLRDTDTTCVEASVAHLPICHGLALDIFPLDGYPDAPLEQRLLELKKRVYVRLLSIPCARPEPWKESIVRLFRPLVPERRIARIAARYTKCLCAWPAADAVLVANHGNWQGRLDYHKKSVFGAGRTARFETLSVRIPADADGYLQQKYGNYREDPPPQRQRSHHRYQYLDPARPFTAYLSGCTDAGASKPQGRKKRSVSTWFI